MSDAEERGFLRAIEENPGDLASRRAYADWLEDHGRRYEAILQRVAANVSWIFYKIRRKSDGLYADGNGGWGAKGKEWRKLSVLKGHLSMYGSWDGKYLKTAWSDLEIAVFEVPLHPAIALRLSGKPRNVILEEPKA